MKSEQTIILVGGRFGYHHSLLVQTDLSTLNQVITPSVFSYPSPVLSSFDYTVTSDIVPEKTRRPNHLRKSRKLYQ